MNRRELSCEWPGRLSKIEFSDPKPILPSATTSFLYVDGLPRSFSITGSQIVTFTSLSVAKNLSVTWAEEMKDWSMPNEWHRFWRIGDITYTQAYAWLCIEEVSGCIYAIDVEIDNPIYLIARSVKNLALSMLYWLRWHSETGGAIASINVLRQLFQSNKDMTPDEFQAFWGSMLDSECESGIDGFAVSHT